MLSNIALAFAASTAERMSRDISTPRRSTMTEN